MNAPKSGSGLRSDKFADTNMIDWIRSDGQKILWSTSHTKQYIYSYFANYMLQDVQTGEIEPLVGNQKSDIQYAEFAPVGEFIAFIRNNDLYVRYGSKIRRITFDGDANTLNAIPDYAYEEEIFEDRRAMWWAPDGKSLAYLSFNETGVRTFAMPNYMHNQKYAPSYPHQLKLRYPKVGTKNPTIKFNLLDLSTFKKSSVFMGDLFDEDNLIIGEVAWMTRTHSDVFFRAFNRVQNKSTLVRVDVPSANSTMVMKRDESESGWIDNIRGLHFLGQVNGRQGD